ncbi:MAG: sugar ABC transporter substrate-binding protein [Lachnospiraceae bacterium]|nr:sugar ABC transporter substrate-binding protein [Lachnospiraceae bacterium]
MRKKDVKKAMAMALTAGMVLGLTACGGSGSSESEKSDRDGAAKQEETLGEVGGEAGELVAEEGAEIEIAYWEGSTAEEAAWDAVLTALQKDHPEIKLTLQTYPSTEFRDMLDTRIAGNDWPDVVRYSYQRLGKFKAADVMMDLSPYITQESLDDISPAFLSAGTYEGQLVAMPHHVDTIAVFYNKRMFEEAGIRIPSSIEDAWSWEELTDIARTLKEKYNLPYACAGIWETGSSYRYLPFVYMNNGAVLNEDQTEITMNTPEVLEAIKLYEDWRKEDLIANTAFSGAATANSLFVAEQIAFDFCGSWHCSYMEENMAGNWGVTYMPIRNGKTGSDMGGNALFAYKGTKYPKAAAIVVDYITNAENMQKFCETGNFIPVRTSLLEGELTYTQFADEMEVFSEIVANIDPKLAADETSVPFQQINEIFTEEMDPLVVNGSATAEQVVEQCQERMTEILNE